MSSRTSNNGSTNGSSIAKDYLLQKNRLYVRGFGADQDFQQIRKFCIEHGKENVIYMTLFNNRGDIGGNSQAAFLTYTDEIVAEKAMNNFKLNHVMVNYARLNPKHVARMHSNGIKVNASPEPSPEKRHRTRFQPGASVRIIMTTDSDKIFVLMKSDTELYKQFLDDVSEKATEMQPLNQMPRCEELIVAFYKDNYYRGIVLANVEGEPEFVDIFLPDIAKMIRIRYTELKKMPRDFRSASASFGPNVRFVHTFYLARLENDKLQKGSYVTNVLSHFNGTEWQITPSDGSELKPYAKVELKNPNYVITSLNSMIKKLSEESFTIDSLAEKKAPVGPNKTLVVIDDSNLKNDKDNMITFVERQDLETFVSTQDLIQRFGNVVASLPAYSPEQKNGLCMVKIESLWYRAIFNEDHETHSDEAWVQLIDNSVLVSVKKVNIRPINGTCVKPEIVTFVGKLDGFGDKIEPENIDDLCRRFKNEATVTVKAVKDVGDVAFAIEI